MNAPRDDVTRLLGAVERGERNAVDELLPLVYGELRALADRYLRGERRGHTLQATALVHEAYLRLVGSEQPEWKNRGHFYAVAATAMRRVLVDHARRHRARKREGRLQAVSLSHADEIAHGQEIDLLAVDEALTRLSELDPRKARIVELRFFAGLKIDEVARVLGVTPRTVERNWSFARAWLFAELQGGCAPPAS